MSEKYIYINCKCSRMLTSYEFLRSVSEIGDRNSVDHHFRNHCIRQCYGRSYFYSKRNFMYDVLKLYFALERFPAI